MKIVFISILFTFISLTVRAQSLSYEETVKYVNDLVNEGPTLFYGDMPTYYGFDSVSVNINDLIVLMVKKSMA